MKNKINKKTNAFTLVEVVVALGIASVCMVSLQQLIPSSLKVANNTTDRTAGTTMLTSITQDLRNTPSGINSSPGFGIPLPDLNSTNSTLLTSTNFYLAEDGLGVLLPSQARYAAVVTLSNAASATVTSLTTAHIKVYWPATASESKAQGSVETVTFFNRQFQRGGVYIAKNGAASCLKGGPYNHVYNGHCYNDYGYDCDGYDHDGYDCDGYDHDGHDCDGFDRDGHDHDGLHKGCKDFKDHEGEGEDD